MKNVKYLLIALSVSIASCATKEDGTKTFLGLGKEQWLNGVLIPTGKAAAREGLINYADAKDKTLSK